MRKVKKSIVVNLHKNLDKGGAWLCSVIIYDDNDVQEMMNITAWSNASAAKRHIKAIVQDKTPRKSIKLLPGNFDEKEKPTLFKGDMSYGMVA